MDLALVIVVIIVVAIIAIALGGVVVLALQQASQGND